MIFRVLLLFFGTIKPYSWIGSKWIQYNSPSEGGRTGHESLAVGYNSVMIIGGYNLTFKGNGGSLLFDPLSATWSRLSFQLSPNLARSYFTFTPDSTNSFAVLYGGHDYVNNIVLQDIWVFDINNMAWYTVLNIGLPIPALMHHVCIYNSVDNTFLIHGGYKINSSSSIAILNPYLYSLNISNISGMFTSNISVLSNNPYPVYAHTGEFHIDSNTKQTFAVFVGGLTNTPTQSMTFNSISGRTQFISYHCGINNIKQNCAWEKFSDNANALNGAQTFGWRSTYNNVSKEIILVGGLQYVNLISAAFPVVTGKTYILSMLTTNYINWNIRADSVMSSAASFHSLSLVYRSSSQVLVFTFGGHNSIYTGVKNSSLTPYFGLGASPTALKTSSDYFILYDLKNIQVVPTMPVFKPTIVNSPPKPPVPQIQVAKVLYVDPLRSSFTEEAILAAASKGGVNVATWFIIPLAFSLIIFTAWKVYQRRNPEEAETLKERILLYI